MKPTWHIVTSQSPFILGVFGEALLADAQECARRVERETGFPARVEQVQGRRPRVGDPAPATAARFARVVGETGFNPLPKEEWGHASDDRCCCRYCSEDPQKSGDNPDGVWDTLATSLRTGRTWKVHFPELHGRRPRRPS